MYSAPKLGKSTRDIVPTPLVQGPLFSEPGIYKRQVRSLKLNRQMEEVRMNFVTTADHSAVVKPDRIAITVYAVVVCDFLSAPISRRAITTRFELRVLT